MSAGTAAEWAPASGSGDGLTARKDVAGKSRVDLIPWDCLHRWPEGLDSPLGTVFHLDATPHHWLTALAVMQRVATDTPEASREWICRTIQTLRCYGATWEGVGHVLAFGAQKYGENNWRRGGILKDVLAASQRHILAIAEKGERINQESGLPHIDHALCNLMFAFVYVSTDTK